MPNQKSRLGFMAAFILNSGLSTAAFGVDTSNPEKFDYLNLAASIQEKYSHCYGQGIQTIVRTGSNGSGQDRRVRRMEFAFSAGRGRSVETPIKSFANAPSPDGQAKKKSAYLRLARIYNPEYSFLLTQPQATSELVLRYLEAGAEAGRREYRFQYSDPAHCISKVRDRSITDLIRLPNFHVARIADIESKLGRRRVQVDFSFSVAPERTNLDRYLASGSLVFFPDEGWIIDSYKLTESTHSTPNKYTTRFGQVDYVQADGHDLRPADSSCTSFAGKLDVEPKPADPGYEPIEIETFHFDKFAFGDLPAREFTLSAFGLPEYGAPANQRLNRPFPWWVVGTSVGACGLAWALWRLGKRSRQPRAA